MNTSFLHGKKERQLLYRYRPVAFLAWLVLLLLNAENSFCQTNGKIFPLIDTLYKTAKTAHQFTYVNVSCDTFYYTDHIAYVSELDRLTEALTMHPVIKKQSVQLHSAPDSIALTPVELNLIGLAFSRLKTHAWKRDLFPGSKTVSSDSVDILLDSVEKSNAILERKLCMTIYGFSPPVFFRGDRWCIFLQSQSDILTRAGTCTLYYQDKDDWKKYADIARWLN